MTQFLTPALLYSVCGKKIKLQRSGKELLCETVGYPAMRVIWWHRRSLCNLNVQLCSYALYSCLATRLTFSRYHYISANYELKQQIPCIFL